MHAKRLLFINPCLRPGARRKYPPVGLACVMTAVKKAGYQFDLLDMDADEMGLDGLRRRLLGRRYDFCGFGCIVTGLRLVREIAQMVREANPECLIVAGNSVATSIPEILLRNTEVDVAVLGEGDVTTVELVRAVAKGLDWRGIPGVAYLDGGNLALTARRPLIGNLDEIGFPDWDLFDLPKYNEGMLKLTMDESEGEQVVFPLNAARGCPFSCTFCYHVFKGERYRKYSEPLVVQEFVRLSKSYGATFIQFWDELTFPDLPSVRRMVENLEGLDFVTRWEGVSRCNLFSRKDAELISRMRGCGCRSVAFSIENASPEILAAMNKRLSHDRTVEHALALWEGGVTPLTSIIFGYPQETPESIRQTLELCERCNIYPSVGYLQPLPGTPVYQWALESGAIPDEYAYLMQAGDRQDLHVNLTAMPADELVGLVQDGMRELARKMGLTFKDPLKTGVYQKPKLQAGS
ncbi:MAG: radical SAM protein [Humidesulfovibrio sp.]